MLHVHLSSFNCWNFRPSYYQICLSAHFSSLGNFANGLTELFSSIWQAPWLWSLFLPFSFLAPETQDFSPSLGTYRSFLLLTHSAPGTLSGDLLSSMMLLKCWLSSVLFCVAPIPLRLLSLCFYVLRSVRFSHLWSLLILDIFLMVISKLLLGGSHICISSGSGTRVSFLCFH